MVNSATGEAAPASMASVWSTGPGRRHCSAEATPPSTMDQGMGLVAMPLNALRSATATPCAPAPSRRERAMHSELVMTMSMVSTRMTGPALRSPISATSSGTPMKPVLGNAVTSAPKAASFQPIDPRRVSAMVAPTTSSAHSR